MTFEELLLKIKETPTPLGGSVTTYIQIPLHHAKRLAEIHVLSDAVRQLIDEETNERRPRRKPRESVR